MTGKDCKRGKAEKRTAFYMGLGSSILEEIEENVENPDSSVCENDILKRRAGVITSYVGNSQSISLKRA